MIIFVWLALVLTQTGVDSGVIRVQPPEKGLFAKRLDCMGIQIKAGEAVADEALLEARTRLRRCSRDVRLLREFSRVRGGRRSDVHMLGRGKEAE